MSKLQQPMTGHDGSSGISQNGATVPLGGKMREAERQRGREADDAKFDQKKTYRK